MSNEFRIKRACLAGTPERPPADARPLVDGSPILIYPESGGVNGYGYPCNTSGRPYCELGRSRSNDTTLSFWNALYPAVSSGSSLVRAELFDPRLDDWFIYEGVLHRYTLSPVAGAGTHPYNGFRVRLSELSRLAGWDA